MNSVDDLYRLLLEREKAFQDKTQDVFGQVPFLCDAIITHLQVPPTEIGWISIDMVGFEIILMVSVPVNNPQMLVPPGTKPAQLLTIVLPTSVVDTGESESIVQYLEETFDVRKYDGQSDPTTDGELTGIVNIVPTTRRILH